MSDWPAWGVPPPPDPPDPGATTGPVDASPVDDQVVDLAQGQSFSMPVDRVFTITGRGTVVTGRVERGSVAVGEVVEIVGTREAVTATVKSIERLRKTIDVAQAGDDVALLLDGTRRGAVERGQVVVKRDLVTAPPGLRLY